MHKSPFYAYLHILPLFAFFMHIWGNFLDKTYFMPFFNGKNAGHSISGLLFYVPKQKATSLKPL